MHRALVVEPDLPVSIKLTQILTDILPLILIQIDWRCLLVKYSRYRMRWFKYSTVRNKAQQGKVRKAAVEL